MTREEAQKTLLLYRPGTADADDVEIAAALALAKQDAELSRWLEQHCAQHQILRARIRDIPVPAGLKEQIISERLVHTQKRVVRRTVLLAAFSAALILIGWWAAGSWQRPSRGDTFANYRSRMVKSALRGYAMNFESGDLTQIHSYLAKRNAGENYELPAALRKATATGCAIENWQGANVAMICFHTGRPLPPGGKSDLWLFVVDRASVKNAPLGDSPQFARVNKLITATWTRGDKLYLLGTFGDEGTVRGWL